VSEGRTAFLAQFPRLATEEMRRLLDDPADPATFERCKLSRSPEDAAATALHSDLLRLRREDAPQRDGDLDGAVLSACAFVLRWRSRSGDRLLVVNLGPDFRLEPAPEPLLGPPAGARWRVHWSSEYPCYGGLGTPELDTDESGWRIPAESAVLLAPRASDAR
jgi:maltooligosyltrehalose trehalohydrolase